LQWRGWRFISWRRLLIGSVLLSLTMLATVGLGQFVRQYPLQQIKIIASFQQVSEPVLTQAIHQALQKNIEAVRVATLAEFVDHAAVTDARSLPLMAVDVQAIRDELSHFAWIDQVKVARRWPNTLEVSVQEQTPAAVFNGAYWVNARGELFAPLLTEVPKAEAHKTVDKKLATGSLPPMSALSSSIALSTVVLPPQPSVTTQLAARLPHLSGPLDQAEPIIRMYQQYANLLRSAKISTYMDPLNSAAGNARSDTRLILRKLQLTDQFGWILGLQQAAEDQQNPLSFSVALDQRQPLKKLQRFIYFYDQLAAQRMAIKSVDVRYAHGLAVEWRDGQSPNVDALAITK
jgi:hypothetical protein